LGHWCRGKPVFGIGEFRKKSGKENKLNDVGKGNARAGRIKGKHQKVDTVDKLPLFFASTY
jgi:hypothetical protein